MVAAKATKPATKRAADEKESQPPSSLRPIDAGSPENYDPWAGWEDPNLPPHPMVDDDVLAKALRAVLKYGLPLTTRTAGHVLPLLRSVIARSIHPYDPASRVDAFNKLLVRLIIELDDEDSGRALAVLFAIAKGTRGTTLTSRREKAAAILNYEMDHFRKRKEPELLAELAQALYADLLRYKRRIRRAPMSEEPTGDTPRITEQDFTHQEELVSRIWQHVYGLRAELIAAGRLGADPAYASQAEDHRQASLRERAAVDQLVREYVQMYGEEFVRHGEAEYVAPAMTRLLRPQGDASRAPVAVATHGGEVAVDKAMGRQGGRSRGPVLRSRTTSD